MLGIGILGGADIAYRAFLPSLKIVSDVAAVGLASSNVDRRIKFASEYGIPVFDSYEEIIKNPSVSIVYIPLPPAMHFKWAKLALGCGKHVLIEKPAATSYIEAKELADIAEERGLVLQENYMFQYHSQISKIKDLLSGDRIGEIHMYRSCFCFPRRSTEDFRYNVELGGGALMDAGGYVLKLASLLLGDSVKVQDAIKFEVSGFGVDMGGAVTLVNESSSAFQGYYGIDDSYQCSLEVIGSSGRLFTNRIFTAPVDFEPLVLIDDANGQEILRLAADHHFARSIAMVVQAIDNATIRDGMRQALLIQAGLVEQVRSTW